MATEKKQPDPYGLRYDDATAWTFSVKRVGGKDDAGNAVETLERSFAIDPANADVVGRLAAIGLKETARSNAARETDPTAKFSAACASIEDALMGVFREREAGYGDMPEAMRRAYASLGQSVDIDALRNAVRQMTDEQIATARKEPRVAAALAAIKAERASAKVADAPTDLDAFTKALGFAPQKPQG